MFAKFAIFSTLAVLAVATPMPQSVSQCNTGNMQCCNSVQNVDLTTLSSLGGLLGINVQGEQELEVALFVQGGEEAREEGEVTIHEREGGYGRRRFWTFVPWSVTLVS